MSACVWVIHPPNLGLLFFILLLCHGNHGSFKEDKRYNHFWLMHTFSWGPGQYLQSPIWQSISSKWRLRVEEHLVMLRCLFYLKGAKCMSWYHLGCLFSNSSICCHNYCIVQQGLYLSSFMLYKGNNREWQVFIFERTSCPLSPSPLPILSMFTNVYYALYTTSIQHKAGLHIPLFWNRPSVIWNLLLWYFYCPIVLVIRKR